MEETGHNPKTNGHEPEPYRTAFWAKTKRGNPSEIHRLEFHLADVAAVMERLLEVRGINRATARAGGLSELTGSTIARMCVFAAIHDIGKANIFFQKKVWPGPDRRSASHTRDMLNRDMINLLNGLRAADGAAAGPVLDRHAGHQHPVKGAVAGLQSRPPAAGSACEERLQGPGPGRGAFCIQSEPASFLCRRFRDRGGDAWRRNRQTGYGKPDAKPDGRRPRPVTMCYHWGKNPQPIRLMTFRGLK